MRLVIAGSLGVDDVRVINFLLGDNALKPKDVDPLYEMVNQRSGVLSYHEKVTEVIRSQDHTARPAYPLAKVPARFSLLKLELLEETSERVRLKRLCEILETVATAVQRQRETAEVASRNGHVRPHRS